MLISISRRVVAVLSLAAFAAIAAGGVAAAVAKPGDVAITIKNFDFQPMAVTVPVGSTVSWKNLDGEPHTVTSLDGAFRSPALDENDTFRFTFSKPGVYRYLCTVHPRMTATVTVK